MNTHDAAFNRRMEQLVREAYFEERTERGLRELENDGAAWRLVTAFFEAAIFLGMVTCFALLVFA